MQNRNKSLKVWIRDRQIIEQTTKVRINWRKPIDVKPKNDRITVEVPTDLGDGPLVIALMNEDGEDPG